MKKSRQNGQRRQQGQGRTRALRRAGATIALTVALPVASGCAGRAAPFDEMDKAQITVLRLQGQEPPPQTAQPGAPALIPGIPPELQQMGQQALQGLQQVLPPGVIPPGLLPGQQPAAAQQPPPPRWKGYIMLAQMPLTDTTVKDEILDVFGDDGSFQAEKGQCFFPGMGVSMARPGQPSVDLLISLSCNQAQGDGFKWPYNVNGFTPDAHQRLTKVYEKLWGPVPPGA
jgi:hypothetical protein